MAPRRVGRSLRVESRALLHAAHVGGGDALLDRISAAGLAIGHRLCVRFDGGTVRALLREREVGRRLLSDQRQRNVAALGN